MPSPAQASQSAGYYPGSPTLPPEHEPDLDLPSSVVPRASTTTRVPAPLEGLRTSSSSEPMSVAGMVQRFGSTTCGAAATAQHDRSSVPPTDLRPLPPLLTEIEEAWPSFSDDDWADILAYTDAVPAPPEPVMHAPVRWGQCDIIGHAAPAA
ncbi:MULTISPECIES: hypothetical protein [Mycetohabitans]|uniref:hypothetical protein n=1 Tax=Mycetohabitans TaxID=2571159 RepID=UPI001F33258A|nr:hypothetical protein [Mycetohabitans sp. B3]